MAAVAHLPAAPALRALALGLALAAAAAPVRAAPRREPGSVDKGLLKPGRAPVASDGPSAEKFCAGDASRKLQGEIGDVLKKVGKPAPSVDERLCALGDVLLGWDPAAGRPRPEVLAFASYSVGLVTPAQAVDVALLETEDAAQIADNVVQALASFSANANHARYALVTQRLGKGKTKVVLVLQDAAVEVDPLPRRLELNQSARLSGRIQAPFQDPKVYVASVRGELSAPEQAPGEAFQAEVACGDRPGQLLVEVRGTRDGASAPLASFPVACGTDLPASVAVAGERWPAALAEQTKRILAGVNAEREGAGLPALAWDDM